MYNTLFPLIYLVWFWGGVFDETMNTDAIHHREYDNHK